MNPDHHRILLHSQPNRRSAAQRLIGLLQSILDDGHLVAVEVDAMMERRWWQKMVSYMVLVPSNSSDKWLGGMNIWLGGDNHPLIPFGV